jgi:predicted SnoaL-like aldol condensation-catalyzing enzyme
MSTDTERKKEIVLAFYEKALNQRNADEALQYVGPTYRQHNPLIEDEYAGLRKYLAWIQQNFPKSHSKIVRAFVDGDYVLLHVNRIRTPGTCGDAIVDIFRLEDEKIVEHWDVIQPIQETAANLNTMF